jgi:hypothetical protein
MSTAVVLVVDAILEGIAGGLGADPVSLWLGGKERETLNKEHKQAILDRIKALPFGYPVDFGFSVFGDNPNGDSCGPYTDYFNSLENISSTPSTGIKISAAISAKCYRNPNVQLGSHSGVYKTYRLYHDGKGGLVNYTGLLQLEKQSENFFCSNGDATSYFNHSIYTNPKAEPYYKNDGIVAACCPPDLKFDGVTCVDKKTIFKEKTDEERGQWQCDGISTGYVFDGWADKFKDQPKCKLRQGPNYNNSDPQKKHTELINQINMTNEAIEHLNSNGGTGDTKDTCGEGKIWDTTLGVCKCKDGATWNKSLQKCVCNQGLKYNTQSKKCECKEGATWNPTTKKCGCNLGFKYDSKKRQCIKREGNIVLPTEQDDPSANILDYLDERHNTPGHVVLSEEPSGNLVIPTETDDSLANILDYLDERHNTPGHVVLSDTRSRKRALLSTEEMSTLQSYRNICKELCS